MNSFNIVIVPVWLNSVMEELGINCEDLVDDEKLSGILSTKDILIYKMINSCHREEVLGADLSMDSGYILGMPTPEETLACRDMSAMDMLFGQHTVAKTLSDCKIEVKQINMETVGLFYSLKGEADSVSNNEWIEDLAQLLHANLGLQEAAKTHAFAQFVDIV